MILRRPRPFAVLAGALAILASLTGCSSDPGDYDTTPPDTRMARLTTLIGSLPSVAAVQGFGSVAGAEVTSAVVVVARDAQTSDVMAVAEAAHDAAADVSWDGDVSIRRATTLPYDPDLEHPEDVVWQLAVFPGDSDSWRHELGQLLAVDELTLSTTGVSGDWPYATIETIDDFAAEFHRLSATPKFLHGGTYWLDHGQHLRIVHVPARSTDEMIDEIIRIAVAYPDAEVLLEATTYAPQVPTLYIARLTAEQAVELDARLRDPEFADADIQGYPVQFVLTVSTADGPVYTVGNLGDVPSL